MPIINLTPHPLKIRRGDGSFIELPKPPAGTQIPRRSTSTEIVGTLDGATVVKTVFGPVENMPEEKPDTIYVVSRLVMDGALERNDLVAPGEPIRDTEGRVIGAANFSR